MTKLLHTRTKIFFPDPYVVRMEYSSDITMDAAEIDYRKITRNAYKLIQGTWGYTKLEYEQVHSGDDKPQVIQPIVNPFNGLNQAQIMTALFWPGQVLRAYLCFKDELDALQFRLSIGTKAIQVQMWPSRWFTIHEVVEGNES